jgi:hypothetical protein
MVIHHMEIEEAILGRLLYPKMAFRREAIVETHAKTFIWILNPPING